MIYSAILESIIACTLKLSKKPEPIKDTPEGSNQWKWTSGDGLVGCQNSSALEMKVSGGQLLLRKQVLHTINTVRLGWYDEVERMVYDRWAKSC